METGWTIELEAGYLEAQTKQRTAYLCRDLVRPLNVSLYARIPCLAATALASREEKNGRSWHTARPLKHINGHHETTRAV